jgi:hypothetical protein
VLPSPTTPPVLALSPPHVIVNQDASPPFPPSQHSSPAPSEPADSEPATQDDASAPDAVPVANTIPVAPPMSSYLPSCPFKVICRLCFKNDHDICYKQCPYCYRKNGGTNYFGW